MLELPRSRGDFNPISHDLNIDQREYIRGLQADCETRSVWNTNDMPLVWLACMDHDCEQHDYTTVVFPPTCPLLPVLEEMLCAAFQSRGMTLHGSVQVHGHKAYQHTQKIFIYDW